MPDFFLESGKQNIILFLLDLMQKTGDLEMDSGTSLGTYR